MEEGIRALKLKIYYFFLAISVTHDEDPEKGKNTRYTYVLDHEWNIKFIDEFGMLIL